jgi:predicted metal-dependent hydrolase
MATRALLYRRPAEPSRLLVKHGSQIYSVRLRRHRRARRYTLRIHPSDREAILTMPPRGTLIDAKDFAQRHGGWIAARLGRLPKAAPFQPGTVVPLRASLGRARHGVDRNPRQRRADSLRRRRA